VKALEQVSHHEANQRLTRFIAEKLDVRNSQKWWGMFASGVRNPGADRFENNYWSHTKARREDDVFKIDSQFQICGRSFA
jgi:hypothetical protein